MPPKSPDFRGKLHAPIGRGLRSESKYVIGGAVRIPPSLVAPDGVDDEFRLEFSGSGVGLRSLRKPGRAARLLTSMEYVKYARKRGSPWSRLVSIVASWYSQD